MVAGRGRPAALIAGALAVALATGCGGTSRNARFYMLTATPTTATGQSGRAAGTGIGLAVGPVTLPEYLNRAQIVTRVGDNQLALGEYDRWAEPLNHNITRVLAQNLSASFNTARVITVSRRAPTTIDYQVGVDVIRFDYTSGGDVTLIAHWTITPHNAQEPLVVRKSNLSEPVGGEGYAAQVGAMNRALSQLSQEIAAAIKGLSSG